MNTLLSFSFSSMLNLHFFLAVRNGQSQTPGKKTLDPPNKHSVLPNFLGSSSLQELFYHGNPGYPPQSYAPKK